MAKIYNVTYNCIYGLDLSLGDNESGSAPLLNQSFTKMEDAVAFFDKILDHLYAFINNKTGTPEITRERMEADYYPSLDMFRYIQYGEGSYEVSERMGNISDFAWKYETVDSVEKAPNYESVVFEMYWKDRFSKFLENDASAEPMATIVISRAPVFESINEFNDFWKPQFDEEGEYNEDYRLPEQYNEWYTGELIDEFKRRNYNAFMYDYWRAELGDDEGFFKASWSKEEIEEYKDENSEEDEE